MCLSSNLAEGQIGGCFIFVSGYTLSRAKSPNWSEPTGARAPVGSLQLGDFARDSV